jgi:hypothetical protein
VALEFDSPLAQRPLRRQVLDHPLAKMLAVVCGRIPQLVDHEKEDVW